MPVEKLTGSGPRIDGYALLGRLGRGSGGDIFLGRSPAGDLVAIMFINPELAGRNGFREALAGWVKTVSRGRAHGHHVPPVNADPGAAG